MVDGNGRCPEMQDKRRGPAFLGRPCFKTRRRQNGRDDTAAAKGVKVVKMTMYAKPGARILFLDMDSVEVQHNVLRRVLEATKHPANPLIPLGDAYEWDSLQAAP